MSQPSRRLIGSAAKGPSLATLRASAASRARPTARRRPRAVAIRCTATTAPRPSKAAAKIQRLPASPGGPASGEDDTPEGEHRGALRRHRLRVELGRLLVEAGPVLGPAQVAIGVGGGAADARGQEARG